MSFVTYRKNSDFSVLDQAPESQRVAVVAAICALASLPLVFSVALTIWGS